VSAANPNGAIIIRRRRLSSTRCLNSAASAANFAARAAFAAGDGAGADAILSRCAIHGVFQVPTAPSGDLSRPFVIETLDIVKSCEGEVGVVFVQCTSLASSVSFGNV